MKTEIGQILDWFKAAVPNPTDETLCAQVGCHYEEISEMAGVLMDDDAEYETGYCAKAYKEVGSWEKDFLSGLGKDKKINLLDALCDQIITAIGVGYMAGFDMAGALQEVIRSNASKFENGKPLFDENGKIRKGKDYTPPELARFVNKRGEE
nr:MAG TPA: NTP-PPase-like protein [Caudoviricetes sp.]